VIVLEFLAVGALWGGSYLFMRVAGPQFGPVPLVGLRVALAGLLLLPVCVWAGEGHALRAHWRKVAPLGVTGAAVPFVLLTVATIKTNAGWASILNSTAPFFTALIGWLWLKDRLSPARVAGLVIGFLGVCLLMRGKAPFDISGRAPAVAAALASTFLYGFSTNYAKKHLTGVSPLVITTLSMLVAAALLLPATALLWPAEPPSAAAWASVALLGAGSTAFAFVLFYRLLARVGPTGAIVVTYLIPVFGMLWGALLLGEQVTLSMLAAAAVILAGTSLSAGAFPLRKPAP
jgi:drug/metabolite transporter (DMT)-like permease